MKQLRYASPKSQRGISLIEAMIVIGLSTWYMVSAAQLFQAWANYQIASAQGNKVAKYNSAVASYVTNEPARLSNLNPPQPFPFGSYSGIGWLQTPPCAGAAGAVMYLPCGFDPFSTVGLTFDTTVAQNGQYILATTILGPAVTGIGVDRAMGGAIVNAANAYAGSYTANLEQSIGFTRYAIDPDTGILFAYVDTAILGQPFLRTDGTNQMTGNLNMGNNSLNNANAVNSATVNASNTVNAANSVNTSTMNATNAVNASTMNASSAVNGGTVNATTDLNAGRNVNANASGVGGNVQIMGTSITLAESIQGSSYVNNGGFVAKPQCPPENPTPRIFASQGPFSSGNAQDPITSVQLSYTDVGTGWQVFITVFTASNPAGQSADPSSSAMVSVTCG